MACEYVVRAAFLVGLVSGYVEDFAFDRDVAQVAVNTIAPRQKLWGDRVVLWWVEHYRCLGLEFAFGCHCGMLDLRNYLELPLSVNAMLSKGIAMLWRGVQRL